MIERLSDTTDTSEGHGRSTRLLRSADLEDRIEVASKESRRRAIWATVATIGAPVNFLVQTLIFWTDGWPTGGAAVFAVMCAFAAATWYWWSSASKELKDLRHELRALSRTAKAIAETQP